MMNIKDLEEAKFIEAYELENGKYRTHQCIGTFKIGNKFEWFKTNKDGELKLTDLAWEEIERKGLNYIKKEWVTFDLLTKKEIKSKIQNEQSIINFHSNRLNKLEQLID